MNIMQHNSRRGALQGAAAPERKYRNVFAGRLLMLLMLLGLVFSKAWGADIRYHIINNDGKECFRYVIKDDYKYSSIDKTELCVHPWARSVVATDFRFYINREDAVTDANGLVGSYFSEGNVISEVAPGTTEFYVRYSMKSPEDLAAEGFTYDPEGNMTYFMQIRERNAKGGKRRQVYYDTTDERFEFGSPGTNNTDIPFENLQKGVQYRFRVVSNDPYNTYLYNGAAEAQNANGVLTVSGISRDNNQKAKERVSYETMISNYDPETTTTLQSFFFVAASSQILQSSWSGEYNGKMFVVGAVGGKDYWMRDVGGANSIGGTENYVPYMLCANGDLGNFKDPGFQLQCYQSWRNYDYNNDNTSLVLTTPYQNTHKVTYHIVNSADTSKDVLTIVQRHGGTSAFDLFNRDRLQRIGCTLSEKYYKNRECTEEYTTTVLDNTDVYIPYTFNTTSDEIAAMTATGLEFSTEANPKWFSMTIRESSTKLLTYDATNNVINSQSGPTDITRIKKESQFAFIGDPYSFRIICKAADGQYAFADGENSFSYGNSKVLNNVRFADNPDESISSWAMIAGERSGRFQIFLRDNYALAFRAFWDAQGGGNQIRLYSRTASPEVHVDANLRVTATPKYNYCYNIVDNSGRIAIKYTVEQYVSTRLDGKFGHEAIPKAIYSPYLEGETLTFYTTFTENNLASLANEIEQTPNSTANIYVRYKQDLMSTRTYPLNIPKNYFMRLNNRYVTYNGNLATTDQTPRVEDSDKANKIWVLTGGDPYDVRVTNTSSGSSFSLFNNTDCHLILMSSTANSQDDGQVTLLLANQKDLSIEYTDEEPNSKSIALSGYDVTLAKTDHSAAAQQVVFIEAVLERTYRIIDKKGKILLEYKSKELTDANKLGVPAKWRSPLIKYAEVNTAADYDNSGYKYWTRSNFTVSGGTYTLKANQTPITGPAEATDGYVYVTYDALTSDDEGFVDLDGRNSSTKYMYLLRFKNGESFQQEMNDQFRESSTTKSLYPSAGHATKAVYPYSNGEANFYIYGAEQWEEQQYVASSRTRWSWYLEGNDPYRTKISSFQTQTSQTVNGSTVNRHAYFRTYKPDGHNAYVTGSIADNTLVDDGSAPSDYMILGTKGDYKLVTSDELGTDSCGYRGTNHREVNSFEQYWKNNPTVLELLYKYKGYTDDKTDAGKKQRSDYAEELNERDLTADEITYMTTVSSPDWHHYQAWANINSWTSTSSKKYQKTDHWFQTIRMDYDADAQTYTASPVFDFERVDLNGVLVLIDSHGWEVARKPMGRLDNKTAKAELDKEIRKYDSPMVEEYTFWTLFDKESGYHKYKPHTGESNDSKNSKAEGTGKSLTDYPEVKSNGMLQDLYVTYTVKPQYADTYKPDSIESGTEVKTSFLIRQGGVLAKANNSGTAIEADATHISSIDAGSVSLTSTSNPEYFWCLRPNFDIDVEMGYYDVANRPDHSIKAEKRDSVEGSYIKHTITSRNNNFDPYNVQIYSYKSYKDHETNSKNAIKYFVTNAGNAVMQNRQHLEATLPADDHTLSLGDNTTVKFTANVSDYDGSNIFSTNATFLVVQDENGNMRLMPRFDHSRVINGFTTLTEPAAKQPVEDKKHPQSTWLLRPPAQVYIIVDNQGREALRYTSLNDGAPVIPAKYRSPLATNFGFYKTLTETGTAPHTHVYDLTTLNDSITTFDAAGLSEGGTVYVRYKYDPAADTDGLLKGTWYHAKLNDADIEVATITEDAVTTTRVIKKSLPASPSDEEKKAHRWRFMQSAGDDSDPYAVTLWNGTPATESSGNRYIVFRHSDYTDEDRSYALMQAGTITANSYSFLDGEGAPSIVEQTNYISGTAEVLPGTINDAKKLTLTPVLATDKLTYKIITTTHKVALTSDEESITDSYKLKLPEWMESPLMASDAYIFYSAAEAKSDGTYIIKGQATTTPKSLDGDVVYVHYDYEKSKKAITSFGTEKEEDYKDKFDGLPYNYAPLDLSGQVAYTMGTISTTEYQGKLWSVHTDTTNIINDNVTVNTELTKEARLWYFTGNDPYEVTISNSTSPSKVLAGKEPNLSAEWANTPNDKYPLVKMVKPNDGTYTLNTFMVLKYNPNEKTGKVGNVSHCAGSLKLYVTGNDQQYLAESKSLAGEKVGGKDACIYIYTDELHYKARLDADSEPFNPKNNPPTMIIYSSFFYRPVLTYHIITNDKKEALKGYSLMAGTTVEIPEVYQSPLLNSSDFTYYTKATKEGSDYTVDTDASTAASTTIASLASKSIGDIYVRYKEYDPATSPFKIATNIDDAAEDGTRLDWTDEKGLDLSGDPADPNKGGTWYTIADMQDRFNDDHGNVFGVTIVNSEKRFAKTKVNELTNGRAPSNKDYLWKLMGDDPYAFRIYNAQHGQYLSVKTDNNRMSLQAKDADGYYQTFMLLEAHGNDNEIGDYGKDTEDNYNYQLRRWTSLIASGTKLFTRVTTDNDATTGNLSARDWDFNIRNFSNYDIRMSGNEVVTRQILSMGAGGTGLYCVEFVKAPVTRKYHYHAIQFDAEGKRVGQTWDAILEHDWLQPVVLEDNIARLFCKYEMRDTLATGDNVTGKNVFKTRADLEKRDNAGAQVPNAQFYSDDGLSQRVKNNVEGASGEYDVYPEIELDYVYDIYFKYQVDTETPLNLAGSEKKLSDITSTPLQIANDKAHYAATGRLDPTYYTGDSHGKWFFMVLDTDDAMSATGEEGSRTYTGNQYFLRREDDGTVSWMNNSYTLHPQAVDNYNDWTPSRVVEWYKKGDNDPYREGRWLWTFVGTDPYNMKIVNMESVVGVNTDAEGVYSLAGADNCWTTIGQTTLSNGATAYPVTVPTAEPTGNQYWGLCNGYDTEGTMSLLSTAITLTDENEFKVNQPLYWNMQSRTINRKTTQSVEGSLRSNDRANAIQLIPYVPVKYQDINLVIKREDHVKAYTDWKDHQVWSGKTDYEIMTDKADQLKTYDSGISLLYFTAAERTFVAGDKINLGTQFSLPVNVLRAFCKYTLYKDDYQTPYDKDNEDTWYYTVSDGPYPTSTQATTKGKWSGTGTEGDPYVYNKVTEPATDYGELLYDEDGKPVYTYTSDGTTSGIPAVGAQSIYVKYEVTSDIFLKEAPTQDQVREMAQNNDHVYFMDFPTYDSKGNEITHHAFYDPEATTFIQTGDLSKNKDKNTGIWVPEKKSWSGSGYASDFTNSYNATQYRTADNRMVSTPDKLKWYFVGDPYKLQVFSTAGAWNSVEMTDLNSNYWPIGSKAAQLARFNTVETNFKFVSDCVHVRLPDYTHIDNRPELIPTDERGVAMPEKAFPNRNNGKPYVNDFYWECVPAASKENGTFALRFKEDNDLLGYRNVYYYLGRDGKTMVYNADEEKPQTYHINLNYRPNNERYESGDYLGFHKANNDSTIIRLVQPVKVYITAHRSGDERYDEKLNVTVDEYSGYYGLGETISEVPRHLQRKYVSYNTLEHNHVGSSVHNLTISNADSNGTCGTAPYTGTHSQTINDLMTNRVSKEPVNPVFKFSVYYNVHDMTANGIHLFTNNISSPTWLDVMVGSNSWFYYDKTNVDGSGNENETSRVSNYRRAVSENKSSGWNNSADGWNDGLKGLHWAFVGDPYDFTILNRRRYEDAGELNAEGQPMWLAAKKQTIADYNGTVPSDSIVWSATLVDDINTYTTNTSTATAALTDNGINAHWSLQMWKLGDANYYFLRTASLLNQSVIDGGGDRDIQTDNYWRMMAKHNGTNEFYAEPYALDDHSRYTSDKNNLVWGNYVTNDMRYSKTMNGLGVYEQRLQIRTAVAEDNDKADNDCFDAKVEIRTKDGKLRISKDKLEIKYGIAADMLPYTLRRYGCEYTCYVNYNESANTGDELTRLRDSNTPMDDSESREFANREYTLLSNAIAATPPGQNVTLTYIYEVTDDVAQFFTTASDALTEDYTWTNTYFAWDQMYSGTNVEIEYYVDVFDHYVYDANGQIIDAVYIKERRTRVESNPKQAYPTTAYLNTHTNQVNVFADESTQSKDDRQKWSLVGDPYEFTMKNYAQYLVNNNATQLLDKGLMTQTTIPVQAQNFAIAVDKNGNSYLSVIDSNGEVTTNMSFTFSTSSDKTVQTVGGGVNDNDPTGHTLDTENVKPFKLANLLSYADIVQYHLVIAHQHSLDPDNSQVYLDLSKPDDNSEVTTALDSDETKIANRATFKSHLLEYLMYQGIQKGQKDMFVNLDASGKPSSMKTDWVDGNGKYVIKSLLKENASLRDFLSYPIDDYRVARVGIGNHPQVPWYMKRQFCRYFLYQSDVLRSEVDNDSPALEIADAEWGSSTIVIDGVEYKLNPTSQYAVTVDYYNGKFYSEGKAPAGYTRYDKSTYGLVQRTFEENGETNRAFNIKWVSVFDPSSWDDWTTADDADTDADRKVNVGTEGSPVWKKAPKYYKQALALQGTVLDRLQECHYNRMVKIDVVYEVIPEAFQFAYRGRNTTAWYQMMTNSNSGGSGGTDYLMNFSYRNHIGIKAGRDTHYTNDYLWAPEGDPYGFVLRSRYSTINGNGFNATAVTTTGELPKKGEEYTASEAPSDYEATYTNAMPFISRLIIHTLKGKTLPPPSGGTAGDDSMSNGIYEMFTGDATFGNSFLMHPTTAYIDTSDPEFSSYYMMRDTDGKAKLKYQSARTLQSDVDANWYLTATTEQLLPYFERAGYVGGISPTRVAANFNFQDYYDQLRTAKQNGTTLDFSLLRKIQETVYDGTFKQADGTTVAEGTERANVTLPLTFVSTNLVNMADGHYRIASFSTAQLNAAEKANATAGHEGIQGQRYISGYRFASEVTNSKPLRYFETTKDDATIHTFADLAANTPFMAEAPLQGNIELLPADFDPSSIFRIQPTGTAAYNKYTLSTQNLNVQASAGNPATMSSAAGTALRVDDIGGAAVTLRYFDGTPASNAWDASVVSNLQTNYLTSTGDSYSISMAADNELNETNDGIHDTKWLLQPVGVHEEWPYNEMPLRVEVNEGGVKNYALTGADLTAPENKDNNYYGTLYVPFDTRLSNTTDAAFTLTNTPTSWGTTTEPGKVTMASVSRLNEMGNPQFVPAKWPVVLRTSDKNKVVTLVNEGHTENNPKVYAERHYVNMYIPNVAPTTIDGALADIKLSGQYLEQKLTGVDDKTIMVFGLPFEGLASHSSHEYARTTKQVGWFRNDNWAREDHPGLMAHTDSYAATGTTGTVASDSNDERNNKYVYHNKVYYVLDETPSGAAREFNVAVFDEEWETEEEDDGPIDESVGKKKVPWPCDVYDVQGRRVARNETPETLRRNNPGLPKGVYIFGGKKVVIK